jgi:hypothetical protein
MINYTKGISGAAPFRNRLTQITSKKDAAGILAELAFMSEGSTARENFLLAVEQNDLKYGEHPGEGKHDRKGSIKSPVNVVAVAPVAVP